MIRIGITGVGFMGMVHYLTYQKLPGVEVVAIADRHPERLAGDWTAIKGNFGPVGQVMDLAGVATYASAGEVIADPSVEMVDVCLPPAAHADVAIAALNAGKHVFCEKPIALNPADGERMLAANTATDKSLLIGHVLPFFPEYAWALREIRSGEHGRVLGASFERVVSDPAWLANYWDAEAVGGPMLDLHVHDAHFVRLAFGMPERVTTRGSLRGELAEHWHSLMQYGAGGPAVHATSGVLNQPGRPFLHGFEVRMERATLTFEFVVETLADGDHGAYTRPPTVYHANGSAARVDLGDGDPMHAFERELSHAVDVVANGAAPDALDAALALDAIRLCQQQSQSLTATAG